MELNKIYCGKMEIVLPEYLSDNCCDSIVTDPPYGISFMNKHWDYKVPTVGQWVEAIRVLKPGGYMLCACGTRTQHRMVVNIEDAGFEIRDVITWHYGSGFPKSLDISKAIDKQAGVKRSEIIGSRNLNSYKTKDHGNSMQDGIREDFDEVNKLYAPVTDEAKQWEGYGTALKPATEFWTLCRKPISEKTVAENVLKWGTGGINIDGCRIGTEVLQEQQAGQSRIGTFEREDMITPERIGRFPANVILDEFMGAELDRQTGVLTSGKMSPKDNTTATSLFNANGANYKRQEREADEGGASRFFYCPKPDNYERNKGLKNFDAKRIEGRDEGQDERNVAYKPRPNPRQNHHTTVKPLDLMRYLVRLVTPKGGICLDPYCGSGTTLAAAKMELMNYVGIDIDESYVALAEARVKLWNPDLYKPQELF